MYSIHPILLVSLFGCGLLASPGVVVAGEEIAASPPAGYFTLTARAGVDTHLAPPLVRRPAWIGRVSAVTGPDQITVAGVAALAAGNYAATPAGSAYYALFITGDLGGVFYPVAANTATSITLVTADDDLTDHPLGSIATGPQTGDIVRLYPAWTVAEIFGADPSSLALAPVPEVPGPVYSSGDQVRLFDTATHAVEKPPASIHAYVSGSGWRAYPASTTTDSGGLPVFPGEGLIVRRHGSADALIRLVGYTAPAGGALRLPALSAGEEIDIAAGLLRPAPVDLAASGLSTLLNPAPDSATPADGVLVFEPAQYGFAAAPTRNWQWTEFGWRDGTAAIGTATLQPGQGYLLRLRGPRSVHFWRQPDAEEGGTP